MNDAAANDPRWVRIIRREVWDVPREVLVPASDGLLLLSCPFDDALDEYAGVYEIYWLPAGVDISGTWDHLQKRAERRLGQVAVPQVRFAGSRHSALDINSIRTIIGESVDKFGAIESAQLEG